MWPNRVSNPGPLTYESGALPTALRIPAPGMGWNRVSWIIYIPLATNRIYHRSLMQTEKSQPEGEQGLPSFQHYPLT